MTGPEPSLEELASMTLSATILVAGMLPAANTHQKLKDAIVNSVQITMMVWRSVRAALESEAPLPGETPLSSEENLQ